MVKKYSIGGMAAAILKLSVAVVNYPHHSESNWANLISPNPIGPSHWINDSVSADLVLIRLSKNLNSSDTKN